MIRIDLGNQENVSKTCLLYSGGIDSLIAWYMLGRPDTLYVDLGHRYAWKERNAIRSLPPKPYIIASNYGRGCERADAYIPGRNLHLVMCAAARGYDRINFVAQKGEQNTPDRTPEFFDRASEMLSFTFGRKIQILNPAKDMYKHEMVKWYLDTGLLSTDDLVTTASCYSGKIGVFSHCGACPACFRKYVALIYNGIDCLYIFQANVKEWGREHYLPRLDEYDEERAKVMKDVLL